MGRARLSCPAQSSSVILPPDYRHALPTVSEQLSYKQREQVITNVFGPSGGHIDQDRQRQHHTGKPSGHTPGSYQNGYT